MADTISTNSKVKLGIAGSAIVAVITLTNYLGGIKSDLRDIKTMVKGRFVLIDFRLQKLESDNTSHQTSATIPISAITPRHLSNMNDIKDDE